MEVRQFRPRVMSTCKLGNDLLPPGVVWEELCDVIDVAVDHKPNVLGRAVLGNLVPVRHLLKAEEGARQSQCVCERERKREICLGGMRRFLTLCGGLISVCGVKKVTQRNRGLPP